MNSMSSKIASIPTPAHSGALRVPPHDVAAEQSVLGGLLLVPDAYDSIASLITEGDFYRREHQLIFRAIAALISAGQKPDAVTLGEWFERHGDAAVIGGPAYLAELANNTPSAANIKAYARVVRDKSVLRKLIEAGTQICGDGFNPGGRDTPEILEAAEQRVFKIAEAGARGRRSAQPAAEGIRGYLDMLQKKVDHPGMSGVTTGFDDLDQLTDGLQRGELEIMAGRPSMGKTALALNIATAVALRAKLPVQIFSMEMSAQQLWGRLVSSLARVDGKKLKHPETLDEEEWSRVTTAAARLCEANILIDDTPALSLADLRSRSRRLARSYGRPALVVVDYIQLMRIPGFRDGRTAEMTQISAGLKAMAKEMDTPLLALSQLNRAVEQRNDKRPVMSDLRESGAIEQDADLILFIYRDEVYNKESTHKGIAEIIIGKQRNGPIDTVKLLFLGQFTRFENYVAGFTTDAG